MGKFFYDVKAKDTKFILHKEKKRYIWPYENVNFHNDKNISQNKNAKSRKIFITPNEKASFLI